MGYGVGAALAIMAAFLVSACSVPVERSDTPPEDVFEVGMVAYLENTRVFIVHDAELGVVAFDDRLAPDCRLIVVERLGDRVFEDECDENRFRMNGSWIAGSAAFSLTPFPTYIGVDDHLYIEDDPQPLLDRLGNPIAGETVTLDR
jgi:hypothetical protein